MKPGARFDASKKGVLEVLQKRNKGEPARNLAYLRLTALAVGASVFIPTAAVVTSFERARFWDKENILYLGCFLLAAVLFNVLIWTGYKLLRHGIIDLCFRQTRALDDLPEKQVAVVLLAITGLSLFLELSMIRWLASVYPFFSFYKNFTLLACFMGLGLGYAMSREVQVWRYPW